MQKTRIERGLVWPADDTECARAVFGTLDDCDAATALCRHNRLAVQAGGNCGVWARHLASVFDRVVTFEPDPLNFRCLVANCAPFENILSLPAALGAKSGGWCDLERIEKNAGAHQVVDGAVAPVLALDDLNLPACDLIYLDVEGMEKAALLGAFRTIDRFRPVIAFEDKGLSQRYGVEKGDVETWLFSFGYRVIDRRRRDVIMVPAL